MWLIVYDQQSMIDSGLIRFFRGVPVAIIKSEHWRCVYKLVAQWAWLGGFQNIIQNGIF